MKEQIYVVVGCGINSCVLVDFAAAAVAVVGGAAAAVVAGDGVVVVVATFAVLMLVFPFAIVVCCFNVNAIGVVVVVLLPSQLELVIAPPFWLNIATATPVLALSSAISCLGINFNQPLINQRKHVQFWEYA